MRPPKDRGYRKYLIFPAALVLGALLFILSALNYKETSSREQAASGIVILHEPNNHNRYGYKFQVDGRDYTGWEIPLKAEPKVGQSITVYYDRQDPTENALTDFSELGDRALGTAIAWLFLSAIAIAAVLILGPLLNKS